MGEGCSRCGVVKVALNELIPTVHFEPKFNEHIVTRMSNASDGQETEHAGGPQTTHHPHKRPSSSGGIFWGGGVVCELSEPEKKAKYLSGTSDRFARIIRN